MINRQYTIAEAELMAAHSDEPFFNPRNVDEKTVAERKWRAPLKPKAEQKACDAGLFSDDSKQRELF